MTVNELIERITAILNDLWAAVEKFLDAIKITQFGEEKSLKDDFLGE